MTDIVERLRKMATCIYIAVEAHVADDISDGLTKAANEIERLNTYLDNQVRYYNERRQEDLAEILRLRAEIEWMHTQLSKVADIINSKDDKQ